VKFKGIPKQLVRFQTKSLRNGRKTGIRFDKDGIYETENPRLIKALKNRFEVVAEVEEAVVKEEELTDEEIRQMAKEKHIKSWHVKAIDTLKSEMGA